VTALYVVYLFVLGFALPVAFIGLCYYFLVRYLLKVRRRKPSFLFYRFFGL
jgi:hypothetical protein